MRYFGLDNGRDSQGNIIFGGYRVYTLIEHPFREMSDKMRGKVQAWIDANPPPFRPSLSCSSASAAKPEGAKDEEEPRDA